LRIKQQETRLTLQEHDDDDDEDDDDGNFLPFFKGYIMVHSTVNT